MSPPRTLARHHLVLSSLAVACLSSLPAFAQNAAVTVSVDANAGRHAIDPRIYGVAFATPAQLADLNAPINRSGGNATSSYNWQQNASNRGFDWYFESIPEASATQGEAGDTFIANARGAGAEPMLTIPMLDWVAKLGANRAKLAAFSQAKYGAQTGNDAQWMPDAGNGVLKSTGKDITNNDPNDANTPAGVAFQQGWVSHLLGRWGTAANGGLKYYLLDNEHSLWQSTHREVKQTGATMDEIRQKMIDYGAMVKTADPSATVVGPEEWGWSGYFWSGYDQQYAAANNWCCYPDRAAHGGMAYMPWLLDQLRAYEIQTGKRVLDVFSLHYYPQGGEFGNDTSTAMQQLRNRSTRSLWDPNYTDVTWINDKVQLIPRMKGWVNSYYPGLKVAITEYNWGAEGHINGATTQADIYGIFGREGLDIGARWTTPDAATPTYKAMKLFRNYDGAKSGFGDTSVAATVPNPDDLSAFAAVRGSDGAMTVMVVSKVLSGNTPVTVNLANFANAGSAQVWQLTSGNTINHPANVALNGNSLVASVPAQSVTLYVIAGGMPNLPPTAVIQATPTSGVAPLTVNFSGASSSDPDGSIASYSWNFGGMSSGIGVNASAQFTVPGTYVATLTVTDNRGATASATQAITVSADQAVIAAPTGLSASAAKGFKVTLRWTDASSNEGGFAIERAPQGSTAFVQVGQVGANVATYTETVARGNFNYRVRAFNTGTGAFSPYSNTVLVKVTK
jgi:PKD repeat protein